MGVFAKIERATRQKIPLLTFFFRLLRTLFIIHFRTGLMLPSRLARFPVAKLQTTEMGRYL